MENVPIKLNFEIPPNYPVDKMQKEMEKKFSILLKKYKPRRPSPGRPRHTLEERQIRARGRSLLDCYAALRERIGEELYHSEHFAEQEAALLKAIKQADSYVIDSFYHEQPWTKRG